MCIVVEFEKKNFNITKTLESRIPSLVFPAINFWQT